jgi:hypothetical protein
MNTLLMMCILQRKERRCILLEPETKESSLCFLIDLGFNAKISNKITDDMFSLSPHWKHGAGRSNKKQSAGAVERQKSLGEEEEPQTPIVRIGVLSRSSTQTQSVEMVPPSRVPSARVSDSSIETIRQSLREMEAQLVIAQNTVAAETRAEYDFNETAKVNEAFEMLSEKVLPKPPHTMDDYNDNSDKENAQPCPTNQDIKRVLDDLQWAGKYRICPKQRPMDYWSLVLMLISFW